MTGSLWQIDVDDSLVIGEEYVDLRVGDRIDFAVEFRATDLVPTSAGSTSVTALGADGYQVIGRLERTTPSISVLEMGELNAYGRNAFLPDPKPVRGQPWNEQWRKPRAETVEARVWLWLQRFDYLANHSRDERNPPLTYGWEIQSIEIASGPIGDQKWRPVDRIVRWEDESDRETVFYRFGCRLVDATPRRERYFLGPEDPVSLRRRLEVEWPEGRDVALRDALLAAYSSPHRGYHDLTHLTEVLERLTDLECDDEAVVLAAWFHDAVYDGGPDDEERSAQWAESALGDEPTLATEVGRLVRVTATHRPEPHDLRGQLLCDADLAILAARPERYDEYVAGVRTEYAHVSDPDFHAGRAAVLRDLLAKPHLFETQPARDLWEADARANVKAELAQLEKG